ncbi:MAG: TIGR03936 family radical SAM-associated protein [Oscillospiraceae bacterium]|jgi:radical SAM-linked protein
MNKSNAMDDLRLRFSKTGRAVYISHLDLMRTMQRSFLRAGFRLKYSEGFNPHPQLVFALPLSVGMASECELLDFKLGEIACVPDIPRLLNRALPEGIRAVEVYHKQRKFKEIRWLDVDGVFTYDGQNAAEKLAPLMDFFAQDHLIIQKKSKSGLSDFDISPAIRSIAFDSEGEKVFLKAVVSAQEPTMNPELLPAALIQLAPELAPDFASFTRRQLYDAEMQVFR